MGTGQYNVENGVIINNCTVHGSINVNNTYGAVMAENKMLREENKRLWDLVNTLTHKNETL